MEKGKSCIIYKKVYNNKDINKNGVIDFGEPSLTMVSLVHAINEAFSRSGTVPNLHFDVDQNGYLSAQDALQFINYVHGDTRWQAMRKDFEVMDSNGDTSISVAELAAFTVAARHPPARPAYTLFNTHATPQAYAADLGMEETLRAFMASIDLNGDGVITPADSLLFFQGNYSAQETLTRINHYNAFDAAYRTLQSR